MDDTFDVRPADYTDAGNAAVFQVYYRGLLAWCDALGWIYFNGKNWEKNEHEAVCKATKLTDEMLFDATTELTLALHQEADAKAAAAQKMEGSSEMLEQAKDLVDKAKTYHSHAMRSRGSARIAGMMELAKHGSRCFPRLSAPMPPSTPGVVWVGIWVRLHRGEIASAVTSHVITAPRRNLSGQGYRSQQCPKECCDLHCHNCELPGFSCP